MKVSIPADTLESTIEFPCPSCAKQITHKLQIQENYKSAYFLRKEDPTIETRIICHRCEYEVNLIIDFTPSQHFLNLPDVPEGLLEINNVLDPYSELGDQFDSIESKEDFFVKFKSEMSNLKQLNDIEAGSLNLNLILKKQIFIAGVTSMETYLSDTFITLVLEDDILIRRFVESNPDFKNRKFDLKDLFEQHDKIKVTCKTILYDTIYHNLPKIREMYREVLKIEFPPIADINSCVSARHDLVHRNGKTKEGTSIFLNTQVVINTIKIIENFIEFIEDGCKKAFPNRKWMPYDGDLPF